MVVEIFEDLFGSTVDPLDKKTKDIRRFTFSNSDTKASVQVITWGATITSLKVADNKGNISDIVCGFDDIKGYQKENNPYFGATIGRICNRVANGRFTLDGKEINVSKNWNNKHELHGGFIGFDKVVWDIVQVDKKGGSVTLSHINPDGHEGYPGELKATVIFKMNKSGSFQVTFLATTNKTTAVNLTNHSYFNLAGHDAGSSKLYEHLIKINADKITITDEDSIPTGGFMEVENTPFDLRQIDNLGVRLRNLKALGFDDNFCVNFEPNKMTKIAKAYHRQSGRWMEVASNQPGVQFYTSNFMPDPAKNEEPIIGKGGAKYWKHGAFCFETQKYPDAVNHPNFPSTILKPGETYTHDVVFTFGVCED